jgi:hypothetical protein
MTNTIDEQPEEGKAYLGPATCKYCESLVDQSVSFCDVKCAVAYKERSKPPSHSPEVLVKALEISVDVIHGWHNMSSNPSRLSKEQIDLAWKIYYEKSPEMKPIREALTSYREGKGDEQGENAVLFADWLMDNNYGCKVNPDGGYLWYEDDDPDSVHTTKKLYAHFLTKNL